MSRKDALLRLRERLIAQRDDLRQKISEELGQAFSSDDGINDIGETAKLEEGTGLHTQLAALESRELVEIQQALKKFATGRFGVCEGCNKPIPIARLQVLPFVAACVDCQRRSERRGSTHDSKANWAGAMEYEQRSSFAEPVLEEYSGMDE